MDRRIPRARPRPWSAEEDAILAAGRAATPQLSYSQIGASIGRAQGSTASRWDTICGGRMGRRLAGGVMEKNFDIPVAVLEDRARREAIPRGQFDWLPPGHRPFGDPPAGYSALDRRRQEEAR